MPSTTDIRQRLVEADLVECTLALPGQLLTNTPGRYVGAEAVEEGGEPLDEKMSRLTAEQHALFAESAKLEKAIKKNLEALGYGR